MNVRILGATQAEALDAADWYDQQVPGLGSRFLVALDLLVANIAAHPRMYSRARRGPVGREVRETLVPGFLFVAVYEVTDTEALILSITHARAATRPWRQRLPDPPADP